MTKITFIDYKGTERTLNIEDGLSLMEAAVTNMIPGVDGDCGGACACATCHIHVDAAWLTKLPPMESTERSMLELAPNCDDTSRLGCRITVGPELEGLIVRTPQSQH